MALGSGRNQLFLEHVNRHREDKEARLTDTVATFTKVTKDYHTFLTWDEGTKAMIENVVGQLINIV